MFRHTQISHFLSYIPLNYIPIKNLSRIPCFTFPSNPTAAASISDANVAQAQDLKIRGRHHSALER